MEDKKLKVLSVCTSAYSGGAARAAFRIHQGVNAFGIDSTMLVKGDGNSSDKVVGLNQFIPSNLLYRIWNWTMNKCKNKWQHYQWGKYPEKDNIFMSDLRSIDFCRVLQNLDYDVLHLHWVNLRFLPLEELNKTNKPIVWTLHDSWPFCGICHYFLDCDRYKNECGNCPFLHSKDDKDLSHAVWKRKKKIYDSLDLHIVSPSKWLADCAKQSSLLGNFPIQVIPNCLDSQVFRPLQQIEISPKWRNFKEKRLEKSLILYGAMNAATDKRKGFASLLSALRILADSRERKYELIVFGTEKGLERIPETIPITFAGYISDTEELVSLYNIADVMVVPSQSEVFGQTASEALACGLPVTIFKCTGIQEVVDHKINGYAAQPFDCMDLAYGIEWCVENRGNLSQKARQKVLAQYTPKIVCEQYVNLYKNIL